jgi:hypothetical protein
VQCVNFSEYFFYLKIDDHFLRFISSCSLSLSKSEIPAPGSETRRLEAFRVFEVASSLLFVCHVKKKTMGQYCHGDKEAC